MTRNNPDQPTTDNIIVDRLQTYTPEDAADIGRLMQHLTSKATGAPMDEELLRTIIDSPLHDQFVARLNSRMVGAATLSIITGPVAGKQAWLNDLVSDPEVKGVGSALWSALGARCIELGAPKLNFTSGKNRIAAHHFYDKKGAQIRDTDVYIKDFSQSE